jgi:hypothetical protein
MIAGVSIDDAMCAIKWFGAMSFNDIRRGLRHFGIKFGRLKPFTDETKWNSKQFKHALPDYAIMEIRNDQVKDKSHVVVLRDLIVYDPIIGYPIPYLSYRRGVMDAVESYFTRCLPILSYQ